MCARRDVSRVFHHIGEEFPEETCMQQIDFLVACADVQRHALKRASPDILFSSSWGSAVALKLLADRDFDGPAVLLCPAHRVLLDERDADDLERRVAALPKHVKRSCVLVHGTADATVDVSHSKALSETAGIDLVLVDGGSHGLGKPTADGTLFAILLDRLHIHRKNRKGSQRDARLPKDVFLLDGLPAPPPVA